MKCKKTLKVLAIIAAIGGCIAAAYCIVKKMKEKKAEAANEEESYVSCSCCEAE